MFKAFTENISTFLGGEKPADEEGSVEAKAKDESELGPESDAAQGQPDQGTSDTDKGSGEGQNSHSAPEKSGGKVPPPRPKPPLTPATSLCKPDASTEGDSEKPTSESGASGGSGPGSVTGGDDTGSTTESETAKKDKIDEKLDEVAGKAKEWGSKLFLSTLPCTFLSNHQQNL